MNTDPSTLIKSMEDRFADRVVETGLVRFPMMDLVPDGALADDDAVGWLIAQLDVRIDVDVRCTFAGSLEEPPEYALYGDWAVIDVLSGHVVGSGLVLDGGEWDDDPFSMLRQFDRPA